MPRIRSPPDGAGAGAAWPSGDGSGGGVTSGAGASGGVACGAGASSCAGRRSCSVGSAGGVGTGVGAGSRAATQAAPKVIRTAAMTAAGPTLRRKRSAPLSDRLALARRHAQPLGPDAHLDRLEPFLAGRDQELRDRVFDVLLNGATQRTRSHVRIIAALGQEPLDRGVVDIHGGALGRE